ncbi:MAG TPA: ribosome maturation factor RimP [Acidimicrobiia bacterium]
MTERAERIRAQLEPAVAELGLDLYDVTFQGGGQATLRVLVDRSGGVDLDMIERATHRLSTELDQLDPVRGRYTLEVSSPGVERPLRTPGHYAGAVGETVAVKTRDAEGRAQRAQGTLVGADESGIRLLTSTGDEHIDFASIESARTVFEWGPAPKPGKGTKPGRKKEPVR